MQGRTPRWIAAFSIAAALTPSTAAAHTSTDSHAREHRELAVAQERQARRLRSMTPAQRRSHQRRIRARAAAIQRRAAGPPESVGQWGAPFGHRSFGMHAALLPTGKVLFYSLPLGPFQSQPNSGLAWLWDPALGSAAAAFEEIDPPLVDADGDGSPETAPLYCSGQSFLPDGRLLVAGGNRSWANGVTQHDYVGWEGVLTFDPWTETWEQEPDMNQGRWYPTQVLTATGSTLIVAGYTEELPGGIHNLDVERRNADGSMDELAQLPADNPIGLYPHLFSLTNGLIGLAGPASTDTGFIDPATGVVNRRIGTGDDPRSKMLQPRIGATAVLRPGLPDVVTMIGGYDNSGQHPDGTPRLLPHPATATTETVDFTPSSGTPKFVADAPMNVARAQHNTVILPDGGLVTVGGAAGRNVAQGSRWTYPGGDARPVELLDRGSGTWRLGAAQAEDRGYHSTALLLPDGRVMSAGDDINPNATSDTIELYSPPYLFKGPRPVITSAPAKAAYGSAIQIGTPDADVERVVLVAPGSTTHAVDMTQRHVELTVEQAADGTDVVARAPAHGGVAPPGWHMLFVLDDEGVPSVAKWIEVGEIGHGPPPPPPPPDDEEDDGEQQGGGDGGGDGAGRGRDAGAPGPPAPLPRTSTDTPRRGAPTMRDASPPAARLRVLAKDVRSLVRAGRMTFSLSLDEPARVSAELRLQGARSPLASLAPSTRRPGTHRLTLKLSKSARRRLRGKRFTLTTTVRDTAGNTRRVTTSGRAPKR